MTRTGISLLVGVGLLTFGYLSSAWAADPYLEARSLLAKGSFVQGVKKYYRCLLTSQRLLSLDVRRQDLAKVKANLALTSASTAWKDPERLLATLIDRILWEMETARSHLDALVARHPNSALLVFLKVEFLLTQRLGEDAVHWFNVLKDFPKATGLIQVARFLLQKSGMEDPPTPEARKAAMLRRAFRLLDTLEREAARELFLEVTRSFPKDPEAFRALADLALDAGKPDEAGSIVEGWQASHGNPLFHPIGEARIRFAQEKFAQVIQLLQPVVKQDAQNEYAQRFLAESLFQTGEFQGALPLFRLLHQSDPQNPSLIQRLSSSAEETGETEEALAVLARAVVLFPQEAYYRAETARLQERMGNVEEAGKIYAALASGTGGPLQVFAAEKSAEMAGILAERARVAERQRETVISDTVVLVPPASAAARPSPAVAGVRVPPKRKKQEYAFLKALYE